MRVTRLLQTAAFGLAIVPLALGSPRAASADPATVSTKIHLTMPAATLACPKTLSFAGTLTISGLAPTAPRVARYTWVRSDGATGPMLTSPLGPDGAEIHVATTWQLGANYTGWEALRVFSPAPYISHHHDFALTCPLEMNPVRQPPHHS